MKGRVKWWDGKRGFGFITPDNGNDDVFVHYTAIQGVVGHKNLADGQEVAFEIAKDDRGRTRAANVIPGRYAEVQPYKE